MAITNAKKTHKKTTASHQRQPKTSRTHPTHSQHHNHQQTTQPVSIIGTKTAKCDICKTTTKTYLLNYGFSLCKDCIDICAMILEQLQLTETEPPTDNAAKPETHAIAEEQTQ